MELSSARLGFLAAILFSADELDSLSPIVDGLLLRMYDSVGFPDKCYASKVPGIRSRRVGGLFSATLREAKCLGTNPR